MKKTVKKRTSIKKGKSLKRKSVKGGTKKRTVKKRTVKKRTVKGTSVKKGTTSKEEDKKECPVCLEYITDDDEITLRCTHTFHKTCMTMNCNMSQFDEKNPCNCPMCRTKLTDVELDTLGIKYPTRKIGPPPNLAPFEYPPYLETIEEFKEYVNTKLEAEYSRTPLDALDVLMNVLKEFSGTDNIPNHVIRGIMEFRLKHRSIPNRSIFLLQNTYEFTYEFTKILEEGDVVDRSRKYFEYTFDEALIADGILEHIISD